MLGELYKPSGLALETAKAVLELEDVYGCNVALGCSNGCSYCYGSLASRCSRKEWLNVKLPREKPIELVRKQLMKAYEKKPLSLMSSHGYFISFLTDPFLPENRKNTNELVDFLQRQSHSRIATLSKLGIPDNESDSVRIGVSMVTLDDEFRSQYEPNTLPYQNRLQMLCHSASRYTWVSMEPYPCSAIWKQPIEPLLEELNFWGEPKLIVFGKWNYDARAKTEQARKEYAENIKILTDFCKSKNIRLHVKSDTLKFCEASLS